MVFKFDKRLWIEAVFGVAFSSFFMTVANIIVNDWDLGTSILVAFELNVVANVCIMYFYRHSFNESMRVFNFKNIFLCEDDVLRVYTAKTLVSVFCAVLAAIFVNF